MDDPPLFGTPIYAALGRLVVEWNHLEGQLKEMLARFCGPRPQTPDGIILAKIVTAELGSRGLAEALQAVARDLVEDEATTDSILHAVKCYELLRGHRNYYVHGIQQMMPIPAPKGPLGIISNYSAKGRANYHYETVNPATLGAVTAQITDLRRYVNQIALLYVFEAEPSVWAARIARKAASAIAARETSPRSARALSPDSNIWGVISISV